MILSFGNSIIDGEYLLHSSFAKLVNFSYENHLLTLGSENLIKGPVNISTKNINYKNVIKVNICYPEIKFYFKNKTSIKYRVDKNIIVNCNLDYLITNSSIIQNLIISSDFINIFKNKLHIFESALIKNCNKKGLTYIFDKTKLKLFKTTFDKTMAKNILKGINLIEQNKIKKGFLLIKGVGHGLTPSGDDFIGGFAIGMLFFKIILSTYIRYMKNKSNIKNSSVNINNNYKINYNQINKKIKRIKSFLSEINKPLNLISYNFIKISLEKKIYPLHFRLLESLFVDIKLFNENLFKTLEYGHSSGEDIVSGIYFALKYLSMC